MSQSFLIQQLISGVAIGIVYALIAIGYSMVYGILKFINFGHGAVYMVGTYVSYFVWLFFINSAGWGVWPSFLIAITVSMIAAAIFGVLMERVAYRPTRGKSRLTTFMSSVGVALLVTYTMEFLVGPQPRPTPELFPGVKIHIGGAILTGQQIFMLATGIVLLILLQLFISKTRQGKAIRACSEDMGAAFLMGIDVNRSISISFAIGSAMAAVAGTLVGIYYNAVYPTMGWLAGLKGFICAVTGGIGSIPGAMLGGMLLGMGENLGAGLLASGYRDAIAFTILILVMIFRPMGIIAREQKSSL
jgi:branched-chain amino acid transport system permease protein